MELNRKYAFWFVTGSQHLYGPKTLEQVEVHSKAIVESLNGNANMNYPIEFKTVLKTSEEINDLIVKANSDENCAGLIGWMHTFSPAKMWIKGLNKLQKPFVQFHTQYNKEIPWETIDMDFMNLNQTAHGGREFGFINTRMRKPRKIIVGHYTDPKALDELSRYMNVAVALCESQNLKIARFGDNMRDVAVTEGDKVEAEIKLGWSINGYALGDLVQVVDRIDNSEVDALLEEYKTLYNIPDQSEETMERIKVQARLELGIEKFLVEGGFKAFTTTFQNLYGLSQLPGLAVQRLMAKGYGFGAEGDWKTAGMLHLMKIIGGSNGKGTSFMEDYTYHLAEDNKVVLGAHMLEICPSIASEKPSIIVKPLGIGGKDDPARLTFSSHCGKALNASLIDMGGRMRLIINTVEAVEATEDMPELPVAKALWKPYPNFEDGVKGWILAGGAHHTVYTFDVTQEDLEDFAEFLELETVIINEKTELSTLKQSLKINDFIWNMKR